MVRRGRRRGESAHFAVVSHWHAWPATWRAVAASVEVGARVVFGLVHAARASLQIRRHTLEVIGMCQFRIEERERAGRLYTVGT
jgi:hypothetical protein